MPWGGLLIGVAIAYLSANREVSPLLRLFFVTGFLGALTTFSTFSAEVTTLLLDGDLLKGEGLAALHLVASLALTAIGIGLYKAIASM